MCFFFPNCTSGRAYNLRIFVRYYSKMTWGFVTCGPNEALVVSGSYF